MCRVISLDDMRALAVASSAIIISSLLLYRSILDCRCVSHWRHIHIQIYVAECLTCLLTTLAFAFTMKALRFLEVSCLVEGEVPLTERELPWMMGALLVSIWVMHCLRTCSLYRPLMNSLRSLLHNTCILLLSLIVLTALNSFLTA